MADYIFDSYALLCFFNDEPGADIVHDKLRQCSQGDGHASLPMINFGEILNIVERIHGLDKAQKTQALIQQLPLSLLEATRERILMAAHIKAGHPLSYADAFVVAAAREQNAIALTGDPEFRHVSHLIQIEWLPNPKR